MSAISTGSSLAKGKKSITGLNLHPLELQFGQDECFLQNIQGLIVDNTIINLELLRGEYNTHRVFWNFGSEHGPVGLSLGNRQDLWKTCPHCARHNGGPFLAYKLFWHNLHTLLLLLSSLPTAAFGAILDLQVQVQ